MTRIFLISIIISSIILTGCSDKKEFSVSGTVKDVKIKHLYLSKVDVNIPITVDSARVKSHGSFRFRVKAEMPEFYQLGSSKEDFITILAEPGERINITFPGMNLYNDYKVTGSPGTEKLMLLDSALAVTKTKIDSLITVYKKSINDPDFKQEEEQINNIYASVLKNQRMFNISFIIENLKSFASIKALYQKIDETSYVLSESNDLQYMKLVSDTLMKYYPNSKQVKALRTDFERELNHSVMNRLNAIASQVEPTKLDPSLKDIDGNVRVLSSLKGKYVLLSFWSATSKDCLAENLQLKDLYKKYHSQGFEVYQINLDASEELWKRAVKFDELPWISVREENPKDPKNAILFNVKVIPANYLFDKEGTIITSNIHGRNLQLRLAQIFGD